MTLWDILIIRVILDTNIVDATGTIPTFVAVEPGAIIAGAGIASSIWDWRLGCRLSAMAGTKQFQVLDRALVLECCHVTLETFII